MIFERRRLRLTAKMLGRKPDCFNAASMRERVFGRTEAGSWKNFETVGRDRPTTRANSSIVPIFFDRTRSVPVTFAGMERRRIPVYRPRSLQCNVET
jgi:hypothetical protein